MTTTDYIQIVNGDCHEKQYCIHTSIGKSYYSAVRYSSPSIIVTPLLLNISVLIREVSVGEREYHMQSWHFLPIVCVLSRGVFSPECPLRE